MYPSAEAGRACSTGSVRITEDGQTGLVHNADFNPALLVYDRNYQNEQGISRTFINHLKEVREIVLRHLGNDRLVEVGCGKAFFLEMMQSSGADIRGFDPTYVGTNPAVERHNFSRATGLHAKGIILRHVLEHIQCPVDFLADLSAANGNEGMIYIEVPCLDWICQQRAWFDIYYEHVNYFRLSDFDRMFGKVVEKGRLFGGQYLYVVADLATIRRPRLDLNDRIAFPSDFTASIPKLDTIGATGPAVIWGGASKGVIFALLAERAGHPFDRVIDINPAKQGLYLAATGLKVSSPEEGLDGLPPNATIYVMNPNYIGEIRERAGESYTYIGVGND